MLCTIVNININTNISKSGYFFTYLLSPLFRKNCLNYFLLYWSLFLYNDLMGIRPMLEPTVVKLLGMTFVIAILLPFLPKSDLACSMAFYYQ